MFIEKLEQQDYKEFIEKFLVQNQADEIKNIVSITLKETKQSGSQHNCAYVAWERQVCGMGIFAAMLAFSDNDCRVLSASDSRLEYIDPKQAWTNFLQSKFENYKLNQQDQEIDITK